MPSAAGPRQRSCGIGRAPSAAGIRQRSWGIGRAPSAAGLLLHASGIRWAPSAAGLLLDASGIRWGSVVRRRGDVGSGTTEARALGSRTDSRRADPAPAQIAWERHCCQPKPKIRRAKSHLHNVVQSAPRVKTCGPEAPRAIRYLSRRPARTGWQPFHLAWEYAVHRSGPPPAERGPQDR